ncbi:MAG: CotH kinase family protein [Planctomycetes bacterium]|nr:CotH kinase family protein [Planctomycetota bacterium]
MLRRIIALAGVASVASAALSQVRITEFMYSGTDGEFVEITNTGPATVDLTGWSYSDSARHPGDFSLGGFGLLSPGESAVFTESVATTFRAKWNLQPTTKLLGGLGNTGGGGNLGRSDEINIYDSTGALVDRLTFGDDTIPGTVRTRNFSAWCMQAGLGVNDIHQWRLSADLDVQGSWHSVGNDVGNPGTHTMGDIAVTLPPVMSQAAGYYAGSITLGLSPSLGNATIYYTLDGSNPTTASTLYTGPITIHSRAGDPNVYSTIRTSPPEFWWPPRSEVFKATVVRAIAVRPNAEPSGIVTGTYIVTPSLNQRYTMPVVSVVTDPANLFDYDTGIYVPGRIYDEQYVPGSSWITRPANYTQEGPEWERPGHIEFFETNGAVAFSQNIGIRLHGGYTRAWPEKTMRIYGDSGTGNSTYINYPVFGDKAPPVMRRMLLRNSGQDNWHAYCRDDLMARLMYTSEIDTLASRFAVVFVDGEFWGIHGARERFDKYYVQYHHGADPDNVDILEGDGRMAFNISEGDNVHYVAMIDFLEHNSLASQENMDALERMMDVDNFFTYMSAELWCGNTDWPAGNTRYWRPRTPEGRWQWNLYDVDQSMGWTAGSNAEADTVARILSDNTWATEIFRDIMVNEGARNRFLVRIADMINWHFDTPRTLAELGKIRQELNPEMPEHINRWGLPLTLTIWNNYVNEVQTFLQNRNNNLRGHIVQNYQLAGTAAVTVDNPTPECGVVRLNTLNLATAQLPWTGVYWIGVPLTAVLEPAPGYCGDGFDGVAGGTTIADFTPTADMTITARFVRSGDFNKDGGIDGSDVQAFFSTWETGAESGDFNGDGGVDGQDVGAFFVAWESGACVAG